MGVGLRFIGKASNLALIVAKKRLMVSLEVTNNDPSFRWVLNFVQNTKSFSANHVTVNTMSSDAKKPFLLTPSPGSHLMTYKKRFFFVERTRETGSINISTGIPFESVRFTTFGRDKKVTFHL